MYVVRWDGGRVSSSDSVELATPMTGARLRDSYMKAVRDLTFGLAQYRDNTLVVGPVQLLRFGKPAVTRSAVDWPIDGGLLAGAPGGHWRIKVSEGRVEASLHGYRPRLPQPLYDLTHLQVHMLITRLYLLRLRGREPAPGPVAAPADRFRASTVDIAFCLTLARLTGQRRIKRVAAIAALYHVACWSTSGRTLGGMVTRQRVVAVDGSRLVPAQAMLRFALLPLSWVTWRPLHDLVAETTVVAE
jgi:RDD family